MIPTTSLCNLLQAFSGAFELTLRFTMRSLPSRVLDELSLQHPYMDFYVGNNGDFDRIATSVILRLIDRWGKENFSINLVLPYPKANMDLLEKQFDSVMIPPTLHNVHTKAAITERNRWMVENCDLLIAHVVHERGGAWTAMRVAEQLGMPVLRI